MLQLRTNGKQMEELRSTNEALQERLESMYRSLSLSPSSGTAPGTQLLPSKPFIQMKYVIFLLPLSKERLHIWPSSPFLVSGLAHGSASLLTEMELSDSERSLNAARRPFSEIEEEDDVECDNPEPVSMTEATGEIKEVN